MQNKIKGVYLVTDRPLCLHHTLEEVVRLSATGGVSLVQLREKETSSREFLELAIHLKQILTPFQIPLLINDRVDICLASGADGVHLGQTDLPWFEARKLLGEKAIIGLSIETKEDWENLQKEHPNPNLDYLAVSPVFDTKTKTNTKPAWGLAGVRWLRENTTLPIVAIGGIHLDNAKEVIEAGANSLAVVSAICSANDPKEATIALKNMF
ncbi:thiamine phosphate synthase [Leptospira levettii]|uniref:thiamine phosphate synthase n=1 Tax=Leptospira levettii TaxID=2023178 RepID=UPI000C2A327B|nr:thiamine phosphate synthase [Leptospira levettii]MCW7475111.1 thiamine phosphate synthase [Leptospira levettii]PJZ36777.1 thiamine phosphate synthase [Leptospira levettii]PJZ88068.1 thiamine phosphate synthase [Leptospira levettii]PKA00181.1 thiamine phosphate synthase [Leptospira levettii]